MAVGFLGAAAVAFVGWALVMKFLPARHAGARREPLARARGAGARSGLIDRPPSDPASGEGLLLLPAFARHSADYGAARGG
jgi:hypothetical protein